jgi:hypothetical protein
VFSKIRHKKPSKITSRISLKAPEIHSFFWIYCSTHYTTTATGEQDAIVISKPKKKPRRRQVKYLGVFSSNTKSTKTQQHSPKRNSSKQLSPLNDSFRTQYVSFQVLIFLLKPDIQKTKTTTIINSQTHNFTEVLQMTFKRK